METPTLFEMLIAAVLYVAAYMSLLQLLRYPRNWCYPTLASVLATVGLTIALVAYISVSPQGLDMTLMVVSAGFIAGLFAIIAAPAIDFLPRVSRPVVEFIAGYGAYAGLWMIPPAIAVGYALPGAKLFGLLALAMTIELVWFLRHRTIGERQFYTLNDQDLSVLKTQANGDIGRFAKRHYIK
jgi:hypothetical protein